MSAARYAQLLVPTLWLGMVVAISFLEAPIKFRAPAVTLPVGLGIGRLVFKALNRVEIVLLVVLSAMCCAARPGTAPLILLGCIAAVLTIQVVVVRPPLGRRSGVCLHCAHCCQLQQRAPIERLGFPLRVIDPPTQGQTPATCTWSIYKDPSKVPDDAYTRVGFDPPIRH
jgi:hypothetical protein